MEQNQILDELKEALSFLRSFPENGISAENRNQLDEKLNAVVHNFKLNVVKETALKLSGIPTVDLHEKSIQAKEDMVSEVKGQAPVPEKKEPVLKAPLETAKKVLAEKENKKENTGK